MAALEGALEADATAEANEPSLFRPAPEAPAQQAPAPSAPQGTEAPATGVAPPAPAAADTFDGGAFNPDTLAPELQPGWKQLQAAYTQKTQSLAERQRQFEALGEFDSLQQAVELQKTIQDPSNWQSLHEELTQALAQRGLGAQPPAPAAPAAPVGVDPAALAALAQDPDLAPVAQAIQGMQEQIAQANAAITAQQEAARQEQQHMAMIGELQRQQNVIVTGNPHYVESDMDAVFELAAAHDGNLITAQKRYEEIRSSVLSGYLASKTAAGNAPAAPVPGGSTVSAPPPRKPSTYEEATEIAMETLKAAGLDTLAI